MEKDNEQGGDGGTEKTENQKKFKGRRVSIRMVPPIAVFLALTGIILFGALQQSMRSVVGDKTISEHFVEGDCVQIPRKIKENKTIIMRLDDVQAFAWADISIAMINDALEQDIPIMVGIVPRGLSEDKNLYKYLQSIKCNVEYALHGWDHKEAVSGRGEFSLLSEELAMERLKKGITVVEELSGESVYTFIPPHNELSEGSITALKKMSIPFISSLGTDVFDFDAATFDFDTHRLLFARETMEECKQTLESETVCVVMLHPQDYTTNDILDKGKYVQYTALLDGFKQEGYSFALVKDFKK